MRCYDASTRTDLPVPFVGLAALIEHLHEHSAGIVIIGACARDLLACAAGSLPITRATQDIDVAVAVASVSAYTGLGDLRPRPTPPHYEYLGLPVDVVPYGLVEDEHRHVLLPNDFLLDVTGLAEAARHAVDVTIPGGHVVPVASLEAQSVMKLLAWRDRGSYSHRKDAQDLETILRAASCGVYAEPLYDDPDLLDRCDYLIDLVGCHRLGRAAANILGPAARAETRAVLAGVGQREAIVRAMDGLVESNRPRLDAWLAGFDDVGPDRT